MPVNRNALVRYKTIDQCLQNRYRKWTLEDLIDACSDALYEYEGIDKGVSRRTVQSDIQMMRSDKLGYNAPIIVTEKKYYTYEDPEYSITNSPLTNQDLGMLTEAVEFLKQFQGFSHFRELGGMVQKLEDHIYSAKTHTEPVIDFEKNENLKGLEFLDPLYQAIISKKSIEITYQSFKARTPNTFVFHPYLLKEFRNRWFLIGKKYKTEGIMNLALDRIHSVKESNYRFEKSEHFNPKSFFKNAIGVTVNSKVPVQSVKLFFNHKHAPYVQTKPLHPSQKEIDRNHFGVTFELRVQLNFELEKTIMGFGEDVKVIAPNTLRRRIKERLKAAVDAYETELEDKNLEGLYHQWMYKGSGVLNQIYPQRTLRKIGMQLSKKLPKKVLDKGLEGNLLQAVPSLQDLLLNQNVIRILEKFEMEKQPKLAKLLSFKKASEGAWEQSKFQGLIIRLYLSGADLERGTFRLFPGSQKKYFDKKEKGVLIEHSLPNDITLGVGGLHLIHPGVLRSFYKANNKSNQVIELWFKTKP